MSECTRHKWIGRRGLREGSDEDGVKWTAVATITGVLSASENEGEALFHCTHDDDDCEDLDEEEARVAIQKMEKFYKSTFTLTRSPKLIHVRRRFIGFGGWLVGTLVGKESSRSTSKKGRPLDADDLRDDSALWQVLYSDGSVEAINTSQLDKGVANFLEHQKQQQQLKDLDVAAGEKRRQSGTQQKASRKKKRISSGSSKKKSVALEFKTAPSSSSSSSTTVPGPKTTTRRSSKQTTVTTKSKSRKLCTDDVDDDDDGGGSTCRIGDVVGRYFPGFGYFLGRVVSARRRRRRCRQVGQQAGQQAGGGVAESVNSGSISGRAAGGSGGNDPIQSTSTTAAAASSSQPQRATASIFHRLKRPSKNSNDHNGSCFELPDDLKAMLSKNKTVSENEAIIRSDEPRQPAPPPTSSSSSSSSSSVLSNVPLSAPLFSSTDDGAELLFLVEFSDGDAEEFEEEEVVAMKASLTENKTGPKMNAQIRRAHDLDVCLLLSHVIRDAPVELIPHNPYKPNGRGSSSTSKKEKAAAALQAARGVWATTCRDNTFGGVASRERGSESGHGSVTSPLCASPSSSSSSSSPWERYRRYQCCRSIGACLESGAKPSDLVADFQRGSLRVKHVPSRRRFASLVHRINDESHGGSLLTRQHAQNDAITTNFSEDSSDETLALADDVDHTMQGGGNDNDNDDENGDGRIDNKEDNHLLAVHEVDSKGLAGDGLAGDGLAGDGLADDGGIWLGDYDDDDAAAGGGGGGGVGFTSGEDDRGRCSQRRRRRGRDLCTWMEESWEGKQGYLHRRSDLHWSRLEHKYLGVNFHDIEEGEYDEHRVIVGVQFSALVKPPQWVVLTRLLLPSACVSEQLSDEATEISKQPEEADDDVLSAVSGNVEEEAGESASAASVASGNNTDDEEYVINASLHEMILRSNRNRHRRLLITHREGAITEY